MLYRRLSACLLLVLFSAPAFALVGVSRACRFDLIPSILKAPAVLFFQMLGSNLPSLDTLPDKSLIEQSEHWILESITADYGMVRYYLFVENRIYERRNRPDGSSTFPQVAEYSSPGWAAMMVRREVLEDSRLAVFFANRGIISSVRAGHPDIIQRFAPITPPLPRYFGVKGRHYYYDAVNKVVGRLNDTQATDCNLGQWGFGDR